MKRRTKSNNIKGPRLRLRKLRKIFLNHNYHRLRSFPEGAMLCLSSPHKKCQSSPPHLTNATKQPPLRFRSSPPWHWNHHCSVAFHSRTLSASEQKHTAVEKEAYAVIEALRKWRHLLLERHFTLLTDQKMFLTFLTLGMQTKLKTIKYWDGESNRLRFILQLFIAQEKKMSRPIH